MAVITFSSTLKVTRCTWAQQRNDIEFRSAFGSQAVEAAGPLWAVTLEATPGLEVHGGAWKALGMQLRGKTNQLAMWDLARPVPRGTLRGIMTLTESAAQGATSLSISGNHNQLAFSSEFNSWTKSFATVTENTHIAPDGTETADTVTDANGTEVGGILKTFTYSSNTYTASIHVLKDAVPKATRFIQFGLVFSGATNELKTVVLDTSTGETAVSGVTGSSITLSADGLWWRISVTGKSIDPANTAARVSLWPASNDGSLTFASDTSVTGSCVIWGAQLDTGALTPYGNGRTLLQGDYLGLGSGLTQQVVMVVEDAVSTGNGNITVTTEPALRNAFTAGESVTWNQPKALFRRVDSKFGWENYGAVVEGFALDLVEDWRI